jgi:hypothetical protein
MQKFALLAAIQQEIQRHDFSHFLENPPSVAEGGKGVVVPGCPACRKMFNTITQFLDHLAYDAMPVLLEKLSSLKQQKR